MENKLKFGLCIWYLPVQPLGVRFAAEQGYSGIQMNDHDGPEMNFPLNNPHVQRAYLDASQQYGVELQNITLMSFNNNGLMKSPVDSEGGKAALESIRMGLKACKEMGIPSLTTLSVRNSQIINEYDLENTADILKRAGDMAADYGIELLYESFIDLARTKEIYERSGKAFKLCFDPFNFFRYHLGDVFDAMKQISVENIGCVHIKDSPAGFQNDCMIGEGAGQIAQIADAVKAMGYQGWVFSETNYFKGPLGAQGDQVDNMGKDLAVLKQMF